MFSRFYMRHVLGERLMIRERRMFSELHNSSSYTGDAEMQREGAKNEVFTRHRYAERFYN